MDRLWPRGVSRARARLSLWMPEAGPSDALRRWFGHDPARWAAFRRRYRAELAGRPEVVARLLELARGGRLTLLFGARDERRNQAVVLADYLREAAASSRSRTRQEKASKRSSRK